MQNRPTSHHDQYHPPTHPDIPLAQIQALIPRLTTTINDIDALKDLLAQGSVNGTLPSWDLALQRYSLLLGRISSLSKFLSQPLVPPIPALGRGQGQAQVLPQPSALAPQVQAQATATVTPSTLLLDRFIVHPLNPLPSSSSSSTTAPPLNPIAPEIYFQVLNTLPLPSVLSATEDLLSPHGGSGVWTREKDLKKMDEVTLGNMEKRLRERLARESDRARDLGTEIQRVSEEVDWAVRIGEGDEEGDGEGEDDLFGDGDGDGSVQSSNKEVGTAAAAASAAGPPKSNPRPGWGIGDYLRFMDTGKSPGTSLPSATISAPAPTIASTSTSMTAPTSAAPAPSEANGASSAAAVIVVD